MKRFWVYDLNNEYVEVQAAYARKFQDDITFIDEENNVVGWFKKDTIMGFSLANDWSLDDDGSAGTDITL